MQIVININEEDYKMLKVLKNCGGRLHKSDLRILDGTPLPKWHGRLIDVNEIPIDCDYYDVDNAPTIIEADTEREE